MEYTINELAKMAGVSARTLRYYDGFGLLAPRRNHSNGYRVYGAAEADRLQQILFYRELGVRLDEIKRILTAPEFDPLAALASHLDALKARQTQLGVLIHNVEMSIQAMKGEINMSDTEKFNGFKQKLIDDNEHRYGAEIRAKYGDEAVDRSNARLQGMSQEQYAQSERLRQEYEEALKESFSQGDPSSPLAQKACELHKQWLCCFYDSYSKEYHTGLVQMYTEDPRFTAYYDKIAPNCAVFLRDAVNIYCGNSIHP
jgi:DNA-binding transcriptional MerR regulator